MSPLPDEEEVKDALPLEATREVRARAGLRRPRWTALAFPTRPIRLNEIVSKSPELLRDWNVLRSISLGLCGAFMPVDPGIRIIESRRRPDHYHIPLSTRDWSLTLPRIAVTNFQTTVADWEAAVDDRPTLSLTRFRKLSRVINDVLVSVPRPDYVILPECSLPRRWADFVAYSLGRNAVSLIAGLEYRRSADGIHNEALISFVTDYAGYRTALTLHQTKQSPAWHERQLIEQQVGLPVVEAETSRPPVYVHEDFALGVLICSDLTDIANRAHFRGQIDCLFVPEWNSDLETFSALVESATLDLHAYVVQANNRLYGDGRIRGPYKLGYARDVIRIRGGIHDYVVVGEIDHWALRRFQSYEVPPVADNEIFKPYPIGFRISPQRRMGRQ